MSELDQVSAGPGATLGSDVALPLPSPAGDPAVARGDRGPLALVTVAVGLRQMEIAALQSVVEKHWGRSVELRIAIDPSILGGVWLRVGDTVIDGSLKGRLEALRRHLCAQCRALISTGAPLADSRNQDA